jgi:hypothetical protein
MSIQTVSTVLSSNNIDAIVLNDVLEIGKTNASTIRIGRAGQTVELLGLETVATSVSTNAVITPNIDTASPSPLLIGSTQATYTILGNATSTRHNNSVVVQVGTGASPTQYIEMISLGSNNQLKLNGDAGSASQVLTSGGSSGTLSWTTPYSPPSSQKGTIATPASVPTTYTFPTAFTGAIPTVILTADAGTGNTSIYTISLAGVTLTGFTYLVSGAGLANLNWYATQ